MCSVSESVVRDKCSYVLGEVQCGPESRAGVAVAGGPARDSGPQGGESSNTHLANRQSETHLGNREPSLERETGGEDTLVLGLGVKWGEKYHDVMSALHVRKEFGKEFHTPVSISFGETSFLLRLSGRGSGGGKGTYYAHVLETALGVFAVANQREPYKYTPNVILEIGSLALMKFGGVLGAVAEVKRIVADLGGVLLWNQISRVDLCVDLPGVDVADLYNLIDSEQYVCRARKQDFHKDGVRKTGVTLGAGGDISCRIYDKLYEVTEVHPDPGKLAALEQARWGGSPEKACRVEFQLRREVLRQMRVNSVDSYMDLRADICAYLTRDWLRVLAEKPDRENNNTQRTATHSLWVQVVDAFRSWAGKAVTVMKRVKRSVYGDPIRLVKQAAGCLMAAVAQAKDGRMVCVHDFLQSASTCIDYVVTGYGDLDFSRRYADKAARVAVLG